MIGRGIVQAKLDGRKVTVQVTNIEQDYTGSVTVKYMLPGIIFPRQVVFNQKEWDSITVLSFLGRVSEWTIN